jgi:hypothetical protein
MIIVKLMGGLGNQMFQYAMGRQLALKHNTELKLDLSFLNSHPENAEYTMRHYELAAFAIIEKFASEKEIRRFTYIPHSEKLVHRFQQFINPCHIINEPHFHFSKSILQSPDNSYLSGFFQSEKYFIDIRNKLLKDFSFKNPADELNKKILDQIISATSVSIHIRRGDYVKNPATNEVHGNCGIHYYTHAVEKMNSLLKNPEFFIFSDDIDWAKQNFSFIKLAVFIEHNTGINDSEDLRLLSNCRHHIIANSSFSWWGAWLAEFPGKIVIGPKEWLKDKQYITSDVMPEAWLRV